jgi:hypothetical protein
VRRLKVDHDVERFIGEGEVLSIALNKIKPRQDVPFATEAYAGGVKVESCIGGRFEGANQIGRPASMAAADFQHIFAGEVRVDCQTVIELDWISVGLVSWLES